MGHFEIIPETDEPTRMAVHVGKIKKNHLPDETFYKKTGLHFQCQRCSGCCRFSPGFVFLSEEDIKNLLEYTSLSINEFARRYLRIIDLGDFSRISLKEKENYDCIFWENGGCKVYEKRPLQCRSFPFWTSLLASAEPWREHKKLCPGIDEGIFHDPAEIDLWMAKRLEERFIEIDPGGNGQSEEDILASLLKRD
jgi:Fe-S-cluster containining protein